MANEKILQTRISLKIDTLENWQSSTLVLRKGEVAFATVAATEGTQLQEPVVMLKVGDGEKTFNQLGWNFYAKAADVLAVCKDETALTGFVNNVIANAGIATDAAMKELAGDVEELAKALETLTGRVDTLEGEVEKLDGKVDTEVKNIYEAIEEALKAAKKYADDNDEDTKYDDSKLVERIGDLELGLENLEKEHKIDVNALEESIKEVEGSLNNYMTTDSFEEYEKAQAELTSGHGERLGDLETRTGVIEGSLKEIEGNFGEEVERLNKEIVDLGTEIRGEMAEMSKSIESSMDEHAEYAETTYATKTEREQGDAATLEAANDYTDKEVAKEAGIRASEDTRVLGEAKAYTDEKVGALSTEVGTTYATKKEREDGDAATLEAAKAYTDGEVAKILGDDLAETFNTLKEVQDWVDTHGEKTLDIIADLAQESQERKDADAELESAIAALAKAHKEDVEGINEEIDKVAVSVEKLSVQHGKDVKELEDLIDERTSGIATEGAMKELSERVTAVEGEVEKLEEQHGEDVKAIYNAIEEALEAAQKYADENDSDTVYDDTELRRMIADIIADHKADVGSIEDAIEKALQEAKDYADKNDDDTKYDDSELRGRVEDLEEGYEKLEKQHNNDVDALEEAITKALQAAKDYADEQDADTIYDDTKIVGRVNDLEKQHNNDVDALEKAIEAALEAAKKYADENDSDTIYDDSELRELIEKLVKNHNSDVDVLEKAIAAAIQEAKDYADEHDADTIYDDTKLVERVDDLEKLHNSDVDALEKAIEAALEAAKKYADEQDADTIYDDSKLVERIDDIEVGLGKLETSLTTLAKEHDNDVVALTNLINEKTEGIASDAAMKELENRVEELEVQVEKLETQHGEDVKELENAIAAETERAMKAEGELSTAIEAETERAEKAEHELAIAIETETDRAEKAEGELAAAIAAEIKRATEAEAQVLSDAQEYTDKAVEEAKNLILGTGELVETFDTLVEIGTWIEKSGVDATELTSAIAKETQERKDADTNLGKRIDELKTGVEEEFKLIEGNFDDVTAELGDLDKRVDNLELGLAQLEKDHKDDVAELETAISELSNTHGSNVKEIYQAIEEALEEAKKYSDKNDDDTKYDDSELRGRVGELETEVEKLEKQHGSDVDALENAIAEALEAAKEYADKNDDDTRYDDSELRGRVEDIEKTYVTEKELDEVVADIEGQISKASETTLGEVEKLERSLATVATSGLIDDLSIGEGTILIFDCGDSKN